MTSLDRLPLIINNQPVRPPNSPVVTTYSTKTKEDYIQYVSATPDDAVNAVESSYTAFKSWSKTQPRVRQNILRKTAALIHQHAQELIQIQVTETNCPELWAKNNVLWAAMHLEEMAARITSVLTGELPVVQTPGQMGMVFKRPIGPVLSIPP
jgi:acyl-CoA reductase-like NAD-dependent aldehyde dehydrogenase